ncbi:MAG: hypothetical protein M0D55_02565 [Elusimicrobiota bacterium]|nr:MAG: hypothetical protein M0D55_02565 [Elusimicrobiota bacterium]
MNPCGVAEASTIVFSALKTGSAAAGAAAAQSRASAAAARRAARASSASLPGRSSDLMRASSMRAVERVKPFFL